MYNQKRPFEDYHKKRPFEEKILPFGIDKDLTNFETSRYHIISVPYAETVTYLKGTENAPRAILKASEQVELFDITTKSEPYTKGISISEVNTTTDITHIWNSISKEVLTCIKANKFPVMLGGEHSISNGAIGACRILLPDICVLQIDAHADLRKEYMGNPFNHACALRHAFDTTIPIIQVGTRSLDKEEYDLISTHPEQITTFFTYYPEVDVSEVIKSIKNRNVYITIDLDGFDPSVIPHVGTPEPGGLNWYNVMELLKAVFKNFNVVGADIVELAPNKYSALSDFTAAKLLYKLFSFKP